MKLQLQRASGQDAEELSHILSPCPSERKLQTESTKNKPNPSNEGKSAFVPH